MAQKRMFDKTIVDSDDFLEMPMSSQVLYFHLNMRADDDGFVNNWKSIMKLIGAKEDDLKILIAKQFIIPFQSGVLVIKHWKIHNYIRKDTYNETKYQDEKSLLITNDSKEYEFKDEKQIAVDDPLTQYSIDKIRLDKYSIDKNSIDILVNSNKDFVETENVEIDNIFLEIPLNDNSNYQFTFNQLEEYKKLYQAIDVEQEIKKFKAWCISNPTKRKTKKGILRAINSWLGKAQDRGGNNMNFNNKQQKSGNPFFNYMMNNGGLNE